MVVSAVLTELTGPDASLRYGKTVMATERDFKGNKAQLPAKLCAVCGRTMTWRKAWAKNWDDVRYCGEKCRRNRRSRGEVLSTTV